jgi:hypothetical protein
MPDVSANAFVMQIDSKKRQVIPARDRILGMGDLFSWVHLNITTISKQSKR